MIIAISAGILVILLVVGILMVLTVRQKQREGKPTEPNYRAFFLMGIIWVPLGIVSMVVYFIFQIPFFIGIPFLALGLIYLIIGLTNRDKWKQKR
ncbi:hypothetical protein ACFLU4_03625 [Chloroflexota bacterium]